MATTSRVLSAAVNGTTYTTNLNDALEAMDTSHSGATAPTDDLVNGKLWLDTTATPSILKMYNNSVWEEIGGSPASPTFAAVSVTGDITTDANFVLGTTGNAVIRQDLTDKILTISGGSANNLGANFRLYGEAHGSNPSNFLVRAGTSTELKYDDTASSWDFQANDITTTGTFTGDGSGLTNVGGGWEAYDGGSDATIWDHAVDGNTLTIETPAFTAGYIYRGVMEGVATDATNRTHYVGLYDGTSWQNGPQADLSNTTVYHTSINDFWDPASADTQDKLITLSTSRVPVAGGVPASTYAYGLSVGFTTATAATKGRFTLNAGVHTSGTIKLYRMAING